MNDKEFQEYLDLFDKCHKDYVIVHRKDFLAYDRYEIEYPSRGTTIVWDDYCTPEFICYWMKHVHPSKFGIIADSKK